MMANSIMQPLSKKLNSKHSMLQFMDSTVSGHWAADDIVAELRLAAGMSLKEERAQASFDLCLLSAGRFLPEGRLQDDPLEWLMQASVLGNKQALAVGRRIFEASQLPVPDVFTSTASPVRNLTRTLDESPPMSYYSSAVRYRWSKEIQSDVARQIKELSNSNRPVNMAFDDPSATALACRFKNVKSAAEVDGFFSLHLAICTGTADDLTHLLNLGSDLNKRTPEGLTPLHLGCIYANVEMINILAAYGADASINDAYDVSPLHWAILFQDDDIFDIVKILSRAGANINSCVPEGGRKYFDDLGLVLDATPLWWAVMCRNHTAISALVAHGAEPFFDRRSDYPPRHQRSCCISASLGTVCSDTLTLLLESPTLLRDLTIDERETCDFKIGSICSNLFQRWCMHGPAYKKAHSEVLSVLRHFGIKFSYRWDGVGGWRIRHETPLTTAARRGDLQYVKALINDGEDVNFRPEEDSSTALERVLSSPMSPLSEDVPATIEMMELLLDSGAEDGPICDIAISERAVSKCKIFSGLLYTALTFTKPIPIFQCLLKRAPRMTYYSWRGRTTLGMLPETYDERISIRLGSILLDSGTDANAEDKHELPGWSCCYTAAAHGVHHWYWEFTKFCLDQGSTLEYGIHGGHRRTLVHLSVRDAYEIEFRFTEVRDKARDRETGMRFLGNLLSHPASKESGIIDTPDFQGITPLMWAIFWAVPSCVAVLIANGADTTGKLHGKTLSDLLNVCRAFKVPEGFDISNDHFTQRVRTIELQSVFPFLSKATFLKRLDEIEVLLGYQTVANQGSVSAAFPNTNSRRP